MRSFNGKTVSRTRKINTADTASLSHKLNLTRVVRWSIERVEKSKITLEIGIWVIVYTNGKDNKENIVVAEHTELEIWSQEMRTII